MVNEEKKRFRLGKYRSVCASIILKDSVEGIIIVLHDFFEIYILKFLKIKKTIPKIIKKKLTS